jgi:integrase
VKIARSQQTAETAESKSDWVKAPVANLIRYKSSGAYFARVRVKGKLFRQTLKTDVMSVAKLRLADFIKEKQEERGDDSAANAASTGKMTMRDCIVIFQQRLDGQQDISEGAKVYRRNTIKFLVNSWPGLELKHVAKVSKDECLDWAKRCALRYSASTYNNTVGTLRMILDVAIEKGARARNPADEITKKRITIRELHLPSSPQFAQFVTAIDLAGGWCSHQCAELVSFLAFGGFRKTEAANITWADCDFMKGTIRVTVTKNGKPRTLPMIPDMRQLLQRITNARINAQPGDKVMQVQECQKAMNRAAEQIGIARITHHDLRHLFATKCIESGIDVPTVSRWLGHQDGGALAMKTYGHLRNEHSQAMAQEVKF